MFAYFERLIPPYPEGPVAPAPDKLLPFLWACTKGLRPYLALMTALAATIGLIEGLMFAFMGRIVDWLAAIQPAELWPRHGSTLTWLAVALVASLVFTCAWAFMRFNALAGAFPMRPVISERASACALATLASLGTKTDSVAMYSASQPRKGASSQASKPASTPISVAK